MLMETIQMILLMICKKIKLTEKMIMPDMVEISEGFLKILITLKKWDLLQFG